MVSEAASIHGEKKGNDCPSGILQDIKLMIITKMRYFPFWIRHQCIYNGYISIVHWKYSNGAVIATADKNAVRIWERSASF